MSNEQLIERASFVRKNAYSPISNFEVGAVLVMKSGKVYDGVNIEDPSGVGINSCAERTAFIKAISDKAFDFDKIAVVGGYKDGEDIFTTPCGVCRHYMMNLAPDLKIICKNGEGIKEYKISELLPDAFTEKF